MRKATTAIATAALLLLAAVSPLTASAATVPGDVNGDCTVNIVDLQQVAQRYGYSRGSLNYSAVYDLNGNGRIDVADLQMVAARFGDTC